MGQEGVVHNGVIIPDDPSQLTDGMRVSISSVSDGTARTFGERYAKFKGAIPDLPKDLAEQHDHYRLGTPKR